MPIPDPTPRSTDIDDDPPSPGQRQTNDWLPGNHVIWLGFALLLFLLFYGFS